MRTQALHDFLCGTLERHKRNSLYMQHTISYDVLLRLCASGACMTAVLRDKAPTTRLVIVLITAHTDCTEIYIIAITAITTGPLVVRAHGATRVIFGVQIVLRQVDGPPVHQVAGKLCYN